MTMTLRCSHCNQTMSIAPRKPGSRVTCPACGRNVIVPEAEPIAPTAPQSERRSVVPEVASDSPAPPSPRGAVQSAAELATTPASARPRVSGGTQSPAQAAAPRRPVAGEDSAVGAELSNDRVTNVGDLSASSTRSTLAGAVVLSRSIVIMAILFALAALGLAFLCGFLLGREARSPVLKNEGAAISSVQFPRQLESLPLGES